MSTELEDAAAVAPNQGTWLYRASPHIVIALVMVLTGAAGIIYEYVLSTVFTYIIGNSIIQFSVTFGIMLSMMGVGAMVQKVLVGPLPAIFIVNEILLALLGGFAPILIQATYVSMPDDFGWIKFVYPALIGLLIGIEIPLAMKIYKQFSKSLGHNIAGTLAWDYIGSGIGTVLWVWLVIHYMPITHSSMLMAVLNVLVAMVALVFFWKRKMLSGTSPRWLSRQAGKLSTTTLVLGTALLLIFGYIKVDSWTTLLSQKMYEDPIIAQAQTKYQNLVLTRGRHAFDPNGYNYTLWINGNKQFASVDEKIYHEHLVHPAMNLAARHQRVLILGGGDGLALREVLKYKDVTEVTLVDLDPDMVEWARTNPVLRELNQNAFADARVVTLENPGVTDSGRTKDIWDQNGEIVPVEDCDEIIASKGELTLATELHSAEEIAQGDCHTAEVNEKTATVHVYNLDANKFVAEVGDRWDVVIIDLPDPSSVDLAQLYSREFYERVRKVTSPDGMMVVQAGSPFHAKESFLLNWRTISAAGFTTLPYHENVPSFGEWGWILASPGLSAKALAGRIDAVKEFAAPTDKIEYRNFRAALVFGKDDLKTNLTTVSTMMNPLIHGYYTEEGWRYE